jgi:hypothetical protein
MPRQTNEWGEPTASYKFILEYWTIFMTERKLEIVGWRLHGIYGQNAPIPKLSASAPKQVRSTLHKGHFHMSVPSLFYYVNFIIIIIRIAKFLYIHFFMLVVIAHKDQKNLETVKGFAKS